MVNWENLINECERIEHVNAIVTWCEEEGAYTDEMKVYAAEKRKELEDKFNALRKEIKDCKSGILRRKVNVVALNAARKKVKDAPFLDPDQKKELLELVERIYLSVKQNRIAVKAAQYAAKVQAEIKAARDKANADLKQFKRAHGLP